MDKSTIDKVRTNKFKVLTSTLKYSVIVFTMLIAPISIYAIVYINQYLPFQVSVTYEPIWNKKQSGISQR